MNTQRLGLFLTLPLTAGGCHEVYVAHNPYASPAGIYDGSVATEGTFGAKRLIGAVSGNGEGRFVDELGRAYVAFIPEREHFSGSVTVHDHGVRSNGPLDGYIDEGYSLDAEFHTHPGGGLSRSGSMALDNDYWLYDTPPHGSDLAGAWATEDGTVAFTFDRNGAVFGQDSEGCTYHGDAIPETFDTTLYAVDVEVNCNGRVAHWHGLASPTHAFARNAIFLSVSGGGDVFAAVLFK